MSSSITGSRQLTREVGLAGAVLLGLGSILGTGVFVSLGLAAGIAGPAVVIAIVLAALVALCNALSSAQLAASHPVSGGTYEYGYKYLNPVLGFTAGWMFLVAKSASAATAAIGLSGYLLTVANLQRNQALIIGAVIIVVVITTIVYEGIRRTNMVNALLVSLTLFSLAAFVIHGVYFLIEHPESDQIWTMWSKAGSNDSTSQRGSIPGAPLLHATALVFVAYTGYGRLATLGEEVVEPRRTIPRAIMVTLAISMLVYLAVGVVAVATVGSDVFYNTTRYDAAPLAIIADIWGSQRLRWLMAAGAITAMGGVLLNLLLGLSRVLLAMGRRGDMPAAVARLSRSPTAPQPHVAVIIVGVLIALFILIGDVHGTWSLSAVTVLIYYGLTNLAALRLPAQHRLYSRAWSWSGLIACIGLVVFIEWNILLLAGLLIAAGLCWFGMARTLRQIA